MDMEKEINQKPQETLLAQTLAEAGFTEDELATLEGLEDAVNEAETALESIKSSVDTAIETAKKAISAVLMAGMLARAAKGMKDQTAYKEPTRVEKKC